jgi:hypothetical protein
VAPRAHALSPVASIAPCRQSEAPRLSNKDTPVTWKGSTPLLLASARASVTPHYVRAKSHLRGKQLSWAHTDDCVSRGPGIWPLRPAKCQRWGEDGRSPGS